MKLFKLEELSNGKCKLWIDGILTGSWHCMYQAFGEIETQAAQGDSVTIIDNYNLPVTYTVDACGEWVR